MTNVELRNAKNERSEIFFILNSKFVIRHSSLFARTSNFEPQSPSPLHPSDGSPPDPVVLSVVAASAPHGAVGEVEEDGVDGTGGAFFVGGGVAHATELATDVGRGLVIEEDAAGLDLVVAERAAHLEGVEVRRLGGLLHGEAEFDDVEEELQEVLVL